MQKIIVFDLGGTLMEYVGMPHSWISYYEEGFVAVNAKYSLGLPQSDIEKSVEILKEYNPRCKPREIEYSPEFLFREVTKHWVVNISLNDIISSFFSGMKLTAKIYDDTISTITELKKMGFKICALTNLPSAMPDKLFKEDIQEILDVLDLYISSEICGHRKPNKAGLEYIAKYYSVDIKDMIFVGDERLDIDTAKNANCKSILICRNNKISDFGQDLTIHSLQEILTVSSSYDYNLTCKK